LPRRGRQRDSIAGCHSYRGGGDPLVLGEELVLVTALNSTSDAVDALIRLDVGETLKGLLGNFVLLLEEIIVSISTN
jgi:hypothetical protein